METTGFIFGAIGVIPAIGFAIHTYKELYARLKLFREHSKAVDQMFKILTQNHTMFEMEFRQLLRFAFSKKIIEKMRADSNRKEWKECDLYEDRLRRGLGESYDAFKYLIADITTALKSFTDKLNSCVTTEEQQVKATDKMWLRWRVSLVAPTLDKINSQLQELLLKLKAMRETIEDYNKPHPGGLSLWAVCLEMTDKMGRAKTPCEVHVKKLEQPATTD
ncbi:hypothetical protein FDECE_7800 [Fusarium decemcellulare]|nr:hypothetical protein FDECE_7800 [Fusarium decemcellulare]